VDGCVEWSFSSVHQTIGAHDEGIFGGLTSFNEKVWAQMELRQEADLEAETWAKTVKELEKG
jgi:hypothetical protein